MAVLRAAAPVDEEEDAEDNMTPASLRRRRSGAISAAAI
jgi:hypothetical protein